MLTFNTVCPLNLLENLQYSYKTRPKVRDITFPRKYYPKRYVNFAETNLPAEISELGHNIPEDHYSQYEKETLF